MYAVCLELIYKSQLSNGRPSWSTRGPHVTWSFCFIQVRSIQNRVAAIARGHQRRFTGPTEQI